MSDRDGIEFEEEAELRVVDDATQPSRAFAKTAKGWVGVVANANSGLGNSRKRIDRLLENLARRGLNPRVAWSVEERAELAREGSRDDDCVCLTAVGGDGTVAALINERPSVPIAVLPTGTENLFARYFGFDKNPESLAETIAQGRTARIDVGLAGARRFGLMAGIGFDADVVSRHHAARIAHNGKPGPTHRVAYVLPVLSASLSYRFPLLTVKILDAGREETIEGTTVFVFNLPSYALALPIAPTARADDGLLDLIVLRDPGPFQALYYLWLAFRGVHLRNPGVTHRRVRKVSIEANEMVPVQLDGDPGGVIDNSPWTAEVAASAVDVIVPAGYHIPKGEIA